MADEDQFDLDVQRQFAVYEIQWYVRDVSLLTCGVGWSLQSPEFTLRGCYVTRWVISLRPATDELHPDWVALTLGRCEEDGGPDTVCVQWKTTLSVSSQKSRDICVERYCDFTAGSEDTEDLETLKSSIEAIGSFESDHMTIRCKMIVRDRNEGRAFEPSPDPAKRRLSEDLSNLFLGGSGAGCDLRLKIGDWSVSAHKAVACTRIPLLNQLLEESEIVVEDGREVNVIDVPDLHPEATTQILKYAYSGDLAHVLEEPSLALLRNVRSLHMCRLKKMYGAKELYFRTLLADAPETRFTWTIDDFFEDYENLLVSPWFVDEFSGNWRLHMFQGQNNYSGYFSVWAEHYEGELGKNLCVEFSIANEHGPALSSKMLRRAKDDRRYLRVDKFIRRSALRALPEGSILRLTLKLKLSTGHDPTSYVKRQEISVDTHCFETDSFDLLSREMQDVLETSDFADVWLQCKGTSQGVHECIVRARCAFLSNLIDDGKDENRCVLVEHIEPKVLYSLLSYIYGGEVPLFEGPRVPALRDAAARFGLPLLKEICEELLPKVDNR